MRQLKISQQITNRDEASLSKYLLEVSRLDLITSKEEVELTRRIRRGDKEALDDLTKANLRFVISVAKQYPHHGMSLPDLINEGNLGLIKAAQRFDETRGFKFISYAVWWIRQSILSALADHARVVRLPQNKIGAINRIRKTYASLEQEYERPPTEFEISCALDMSLSEVRQGLRNSGRNKSLDDPLRKASETSNSTAADFLFCPDAPDTDDELMRESLRKEIYSSLKGLTPREAYAIRLYYGLDEDHPKTLEEIGEIFDLTAERVRQIRDKALKRLKHSSRNELLASYLS